MANDIIEKLTGLKKNQARVHFVKMGFNEIFFETAKEAIGFYQAMSSFNPINIEGEQIYSWDFKGIIEDSEVFRFPANAEIVLGSKVLDKVYKTKEEALEAKRKREKELTEIRNKKEKK